MTGLDLTLDCVLRAQRSDPRGAETHETGETEPAQRSASVAGVTPVRISWCLQGLGCVGLEGMKRVRGGLAGGAACLATGATRRAGRQQDDHADGADCG